MEIVNEAYLIHLITFMNEKLQLYSNTVSRITLIYVNDAMCRPGNEMCLIILQRV